MRRILLLASLLIAILIPSGVSAQPAISSEIAPTGKLRVAMDPSPVLRMVASDGTAKGVAPEIGKFVAEKLGVPLDLVPYADATAYTESFGKGEWDIAIGPRTPLVADKAEFLMDLVLTDYVFLAGPGREFANADQVDRPGVKIGLGANSSSDQFLSRTVKSAQLVRPGPGRNSEVLRNGEVDVWAASTSTVQQLAKQVPGSKIVPGAFTSDRYMVTLPKGRSSAAQSKIVEIVNEAKRTGLVRKAIDQTGIKGVRVAPN